MLPELLALQQAYPRSLRLVELQELTGKVGPVLHTNLTRAIKRGEIKRLYRGTYQWDPTFTGYMEATDIVLMNELKDTVESGNLTKINTLRDLLDEQSKNLLTYASSIIARVEVNVTYKNLLGSSNTQMNDLLEVANLMAIALDKLEEHVDKEVYEEIVYDASVASNTYKLKYVSKEK